MADKDKKLTDEQREELVYRYVVSRADPDEKPITQMALAKEYGIAQSQVSKIIADSGVLEKVCRRTKSDKLMAQALAEAASVHAMRETIKSAFKPRSDKYQYINQGDRRDILDRAGVRAEKKEAMDVNIQFENGSFAIGMPGGDSE